MPYDKDFARMCAWLKANGLIAQTDLKGHTMFKKKALHQTRAAAANDKLTLTMRENAETAYAEADALEAILEELETK